MFTWIPIHREAIHRILEHRQNQKELLTILREMEQQGLKVISLEDEGADGQNIPLPEIDPFTFLAAFNRGVTAKARRDNWVFLKSRWNLKAAVPNDFTGIPILPGTSSRLFPYAKDRKKDHVSLLWHIAALAADGGVEKLDGALFDRCAKLEKVGTRSLTICLFWINPEKFLPTDPKTTAYGKSKGITTEPEDYQSYRQWLSEMTEKVGSNYPQVSHQAHLFATQNESKLDLTPAWMQTLWGRFHKAIKGFTDFQSPGDSFVENETGYKRAILEKFQQELGAEKLSALVAQGQGTKAAKEIVRVLTSNLVNFHAWRVTLGETDQAICDVVGECLKATSAAYQGPESTSELFDACARHNLKPSWDALSVLLWALRPKDFFPVKISFYHKLSKELGHKLPPGRPDADKLHSLIEFGRAFSKALEPQKPTDWVDVQSFIWCVCPGNYEGRVQVDDEDDEGDASESYDKKKAMEGLFLRETQFDEMLAALREKKNVVLQGAPGVGKTYVARRLAYALIESNDSQRIEIIQFHQSYSYEDFIQGFRPTPKGRFDLKYGIFHQFCRRAQRDEAQGKPYVFIIDEINRGNLSKIFGELMMLIEPDKRGKEHAIPLAYSQDGDDKFYIPENLHLIGMMNTADRSLAMVDYALRRRFRFITLRPEFSSKAFRDFLAAAGAKPELVKRIVARMSDLNEVIAADTKNLGPGYQIGHSYFCPRNGIKSDEDWYRRVIESEIVPLIQEYWFDNEQKVKEQRSALLA